MLVQRSVCELAYVLSLSPGACTTTLDKPSSLTLMLHQRGYHLDEKL